MVSFWVLVILLILGVAVYYGNQMSLSAGKKAGNLFKTLDNKYADFAEKSIATEIIEHDDIDFNTQKLCEQILMVIKPEIDGVLAHINTTELSDVKVKYESKYFKNAASLTEEYFKKRYKNTHLPVSDKDRERFFEAFKDAVLADLMQKMMNLKTGKL
jgi:hypothetical protein